MSKKKEIQATNIQTLRDVKTSVLIVSLLLNVAVIGGWVALRSTTEFDTQLSSLIGR